MRDVFTCRSCGFIELIFIARAHNQQMLLLPIFVKLDKKKNNLFIFTLYGGVGGGGGGGGGGLGGSGGGVVGDFSFVRLRKVALIKA